MSVDIRETLVTESIHTHRDASQSSIQNSLDAIEQVLVDQTKITFTPEQWDAFQQRLDEPAKVIPALQNLLRESERIWSDEELHQRAT